ncbi:MAG: DNA-binding protein [Leptospiraceae bacterium]|nr:DNA-binding protein [Leptospiraceae bacterium]
MIIVSNTSPIIAFGKIKKLYLWEKIFERIFIPKFVEKEFTNTKYKKDFALPENLFITEEVESIEPLLKKELDRGEAEAITLAMNKKADWLVIDERKGRNIAKFMEIRNSIS